MAIRLILTGKTRFHYLEEGISDYHKRINRYASLNLQHIPEIRSSKKLSAARIREKEGREILKQVRPRDTVIVLDERGDALNSVQFADFLNRKQIHATGDLLFVIGGADGFSPDVYKRSDHRLSLSRMTFSHQVVRLIFLEQLYRAFTIIRNEPYHLGH